MEHFFFHHLADLGWIVYAILFLAMIAEGEIILFTSIYVAEDGFLKLKYLIPILFLGAIVGDTLWYKLGGYLDYKSPFVRKWFGRITGPINRRLEIHPSIMIFISKFTYGLNKATLMRAGVHPIPLKKFMMTEVFTLICWMSVIGNLAWFASAISSEYLKHYIRYAEVGLLIGILLMTSCIHLFAAIAKKVILNHEKNRTKK